MFDFINGKLLLFCLRCFEKKTKTLCTNKYDYYSHAFLLFYYQISCEIK